MTYFPQMVLQPDRCSMLSFFHLIRLHSGPQDLLFTVCADVTGGFRQFEPGVGGDEVFPSSDSIHIHLAYVEADSRNFRRRHAASDFNGAPFRFRTSVFSGDDVPTRRLLGTPGHAVAVHVCLSKTNLVGYPTTSGSVGHGKMRSRVISVDFCGKRSCR